MNHFSIVGRTIDYLGRKWTEVNLFDIQGNSLSHVEEWSQQNPNLKFFDIFFNLFLTYFKNKLKQNFDKVLFHNL